MSTFICWYYFLYIVEVTLSVFNFKKFEDLHTEHFREIADIRNDHKKIRSNNKRGMK